MRRRMMLMMCSLAMAVFCWVAPAFGEFGVTVSGAATIIDPPPSALLGDTESNKYQVWYEGCETLAEDLHVDYIATQDNARNSQTDCGDLLSTFTSGHKIEAGTCICSYFVHFDPANIQNQLFVNPHATITFEKEILGIAYRDNRLDQSDYLGAPGTDYPGGSNIRGLEFFDDFDVSGDGHTLSLSFFARYGFDQIRVFTVGCCGDPGQGVPEPASLVVWSLAIAIGGGLNQRRKRRMGAGAENSTESSPVLT